MHHIKYFILSFTFLLFHLLAFADTPKLTASVSKNEVATGERFQLNFQLNTSGSGFSPPAFDKFSVLSGPNQSTSMQWVNGAMSSSISYSYVLVPNQEGEFTIGPASIKADGKTYTSDPIKIKVVKGTAQQQPAQKQQQAQSSASGNVSDYVFIKLHLDKNKAYLGEQIIASYKIYMRTNIINNEVERLPSFNGFYTQEIELPQQANISQEVLNGIAYNVAILKQTILFPQRTGQLDVDPLEMNVVLRLQDNSRPRSIFDQFFGGYKDVKYAIRSNIGKVEILPLPQQGKPEGFAGAVGKFTMEASLNNNNVKTDEAVTLKIVINGKGNIKLIEPFKLTFPSDFEVYDPKTTDKISASSSGLSGKKEFEYLAIPRHSGSFLIEPFSFSYFDPASKQYITLPSGEMKIEVEKGEEKESAPVFSARNKEDVKFLGKDIRFIKSDLAGLKPKNKYFFNSAAFYAILSFQFLAFFLFVFFKKRYEFLHKDVTGLKSRRATRHATKRLALAKKALGTSEKNIFYEEIFKALYGYLSDKLSIPVSDLSKENIADILKKRNVSDEVIQRLRSVLDKCEFARFAPVTDIPQQQAYENAVEIIANIEQEIK